MAAVAAQADDKVKRKRTANALREQLLREIAELQCLAITTLRTKVLEYAQRVNELLNRGTEIAASTNIDKADSVSNLQGDLLWSLSTSDRCWRRRQITTKNAMRKGGVTQSLSHHNANQK